MSDRVDGTCICIYTNVCAVHGVQTNPNEKKNLEIVPFRDGAERHTQLQTHILYIIVSKSILCSLFSFSFSYSNKAVPFFLKIYLCACVYLSRCISAMREFRQ